MMKTIDIFSTSLSFTQNAHELLCTISDDISKQSRLKHRWKEEWQLADHHHLHKFIDEPNNLKGADLPHKQWVLLNHLRTGIGRFAVRMREWGLRDSAVCECGHPEQTVYHIMASVDW